MFVMCKVGESSDPTGPIFTPSPGDDMSPFVAPCRPPDDVAKPWNGVLDSNTQTCDQRATRTDGRP